MLRLLAALLAFLFSGSSFVPSRKGPVYFSHEYIDTSPYVSPAEEEETGTVLDLSDRPREDEEGPAVPEGHFLCGDWEYAYVINGPDKGTVYLWEYHGSETELTLPETLDGVRVTGAYSSFKHNETVRSVIVPEGYTFIGNETFTGCVSLETVSLPDTINDIGASAFHNCGALKEIRIPEGVPELGSFVFAGCTSLTEIRLPESLTVIDTHAFEDCGFTEITVPDGVTKFGSSAFINCESLKKAVLGSGAQELPASLFYGCSALETVEFRGAVSSIGSNAFTGCGFISFTVPETVSKIANYAFSNCTSLREAFLPAALDEMNGTVFYGCESLQRLGVYGEGSVLSERDGVLYKNGGKALLRCPAGFKGSFAVPEGVDKILTGAFCGSMALAEIRLPDSVVSVGDRAFAGCGLLRSVSFGAGLDELGLYLFEDCPALESFSVAPGNPSFRYADGLLTDQRTGLLYCAARPQPAELVLPGDIREIAAEAFANHTEIVSVRFTAGFDTVGERAFEGCTGLQEIVFGGRETVIGYRAFFKCTALQEALIPDSVTEIGTSAFFGCTALKSVHLPEGLEKLESAVFGGCTALKEIVIPGSVRKISNSFYESGLEDVVIPDSVTDLGAAFRDCVSLKRVVIGNGVRKVDYFCLEGCTALEALYFPAGIDFRLNLIRDCAALKDVFYGGSNTQLQTSVIPDKEMIELPEGVTVHLNAAPEDCLL